MFKACSRCQRIHSSNFVCNVNRVYRGGEEREQRNTYQWHHKAEEIKAKANYLCEVCKEEGRYTYEGLEVHHIFKVRDAKERLLDDYNLICLCVSHHKDADSGKIDRDYLIRLAEAREGK